MPAPAHVAPLDLAQARLCLSKLIRQRGHLKPEMHDLGRFRSRGREIQGCGETNSLSTRVPTRVRGSIGEKDYVGIFDDALNQASVQQDREDDEGHQQRSREG